MSNKGGLVGRECFEQQGREIAVFSKMEKILQVERVHHIYAEGLDDVGITKQGLLLNGLDAEEGETAWKTGHGPKKTFKGLL